MASSRGPRRRAYLSIEVPMTVASIADGRRRLAIFQPSRWTRSTPSCATSTSAPSPRTAATLPAGPTASAPSAGRGIRRRGRQGRCRLTMRARRRGTWAEIHWSTHLHQAKFGAGVELQPFVPRYEMRRRQLVPHRDAPGALTTWRQPAAAPSPGGRDRGRGPRTHLTLGAEYHRPMRRRSRRSTGPSTKQPTWSSLPSTQLDRASTSHPP
jgi:hypothetical protein